MTESMCRYAGDRDGAIIAFLYGDVEVEAPERALFDAHLQTCTLCRDELAALRGVRLQLARWAPPEPGFAIAHTPATVLRPQLAARAQSTANPGADSPSASRNPRWPALREMPAWAQVAAALLVLGVSAGIANLDVRYDTNGLSVRTGWSKAASIAPGTAATTVAAPWRSDLAALEQRLKEIRAVQTTPSPIAAPTPVVRSLQTADAETLRRVRALIEESEKRQKSELALRVAEVMRDVHAERQADLVKIDRTLGTVQNNLGVEVMKTRQQVNQMNILYRASQRQ
jgi:hypothetical protein